MMYKTYLFNLLHKLGIHKMYKGCEYLLTAISFIAENETSYSPITKILYVEIAKTHKTSSLCVERNLRSIIEIIWREHSDDLLLEEIFSEHYLNNRPSNMEFLSRLYQYIKHSFPNPKDFKKTDYTFSCPISGTECEFCNEFIHNFIETYHNSEEK